MHDIGTAIEYLHNVDIAHRDVKVRHTQNKYMQTKRRFLLMHLFLLFRIRVSAWKPALQNQGQQRYFKADRLWLCKGDSSAQFPPNPLLHSVLRWWVSWNHFRCFAICQQFKMWNCDHGFCDLLLYGFNFCVTFYMVVLSFFFFFCICFSCSTRSARAREIRQVMWHVVSGGYHVHFVSIMSVAHSASLNMYSCGSIIKGCCIVLLFLFYLLMFCLPDSVGFLLSIQTRVRPSLQVWSRGSDWASMSFPTPSGSTFQKKVSFFLLLNLQSTSNNNTVCKKLSKALILFKFMKCQGKQSPKNYQNLSVF